MMASCISRFGSGESVWREKSFTSDKSSSQGSFSRVEVKLLDGNPEAPFAVIAPRTAPAGREALPSVLAISGEEQQHVSKFFRAWRAENRLWQVIIPLRPRSGIPYLFDGAGVERVVKLMRRILEDEQGELTPFRVEGDKFHLVGTSNGGASVAAVAAHTPNLVASLTLVTGFIPDSLTDFSRLLTILSIRLYVGDKDEMGHCDCLQEMEQQIRLAGATAELFVLEGARHGNIGLFIDMEEFWQGLEAATPGRAQSQAPCHSLYRHT